MDRVSISKCPTKIKPELPPELKVQSRGVMNKPIYIYIYNIGPIIRVSNMNVKHDMALFLIGRFEGCRRELFQTSRFTISVSSHGYITWSSMNVNRDTVNDLSLIDRFEVFESSIHDTRLMHEQ